MALSVARCAGCDESVPESWPACPACGLPRETAGAILRMAGAEPAASPKREPVKTGRIGRYELLERIGEGGTSRVYRARRLDGGEDVCVKVLRARLSTNRTAVERFRREGRAAMMLTDPHTIRVHEVGEDGGRHFLAMDLVAGQSLDHLLQRDYPLGQTRVCHIIEQILGALAEAHALGILHRDLKLENIMIEQRPGAHDFARVLDFGIAKFQDMGLMDLTTDGRVCGTPVYMSPEQAAAEPLDGRSDLYSVGIILYELMTGVLPFPTGPHKEVMLRHQLDPPMPPRRRRPDAGISTEMEALILSTLEKDRERRPQNARELGDRLRRLRNQPERTVTSGLASSGEATTAAFGSSRRSR